MPNATHSNNGPSAANTRLKQLAISANVLFLCRVITKASAHAKQNENSKKKINKTQAQCMRFGGCRCNRVARAISRIRDIRVRDSRTIMSKLFTIQFEKNLFLNLCHQIPSGIRANYRYNQMWGRDSVAAAAADVSNI